MCRYVFMQQLTVASSRLCRSRTSMTHNIDLDILSVLSVTLSFFVSKRIIINFPVSGSANHLVTGSLPWKPAGIKFTQCVSGKKSAFSPLQENLCIGSKND